MREKNRLPGNRQGTGYKGDEQPEGQMPTRQMPTGQMPTRQSSIWHEIKAGLHGASLRGRGADESSVTLADESGVTLADESGATLAEARGILTLDKITKLAKGNIKWVGIASAAVTGFLMAKSFVLGGTAPFGVAFSAALAGTAGYAGALGALMGYVLTNNVTGNIKYIAAVLLAAIFKSMAGSRLGGKDLPGVNVVIAVAAMLVSGTAVIIAGDGTLYDIMLGISEILLTGGTAYFFSRAASSMKHGLTGASKSDISCVIVSFAIILSGLSWMKPGGLSVGRVMSGVLIMLCAKYGGEAAGAVAGITAGIAAGISGRDYSYTMSAYALGGLVCGVFGSMGRLAVAGAFIAVNALTALFTATQTDLYTITLEGFAASVIFALIPQSILKKMRTGAAGIFGTPDTGSVQMALENKISDISAALREIGVSTRKVSEKLGKLEVASAEDICGGVAARVCKRCGMNAKCWRENASDTSRALAACVGILKKQGTINRDIMPGYFTKTCCKLEMLITELNTSFNGYVAKEGARRKVARVRSVVTDQFEGMAMMMDGISGELCSIRLLEPQKSMRVKDYFEKEGFSPEQALCYSGEYERLCAEVRIPAYQAARLNRVKSAADIGELLDAEFDVPQIIVRGGLASVVFNEKAAFSVEMGAYQIAGGRHKLCGDSYDYIRERSGKTHLILSDGMGSGGSAAVDSSMASGLVTSLLSVGIGHESALKMVNSALLVKSGEESLATIDVCTIDLYTGKADFYKAGAAPSFILRGTRAGCVESISLPAGILRGVAFERSSITLKAGDVVVMVSDGVAAVGTGWVTSEIEALGGADIQRLCEKLAMNACTRRDDGREDDITVVAAALRPA